MSYKSKDYHIPMTKEYPLSWIKHRYFAAGQTTQGLNKLKKAQLMAIYISIRERIK